MGTWENFLSFIQEYDDNSTEVGCTMGYKVEIRKEYQIQKA